MINIYKITDLPLSQVEEDFSVKKVLPIMGSEFTAKHYFELIIKSYNNSGKILSPEELGCTLSHQSIYQKVAENETPAIIFESDIAPTQSQLEEALELCKRTELDFIHMGWHPFIRHGIYFKGKFRQRLGLYEIYPFTDFHGAFAYYVSVDCAKKLIEFHRPVSLAADLWSVFFYKSQLTPYFYPVFEHPEHRGSVESQRSAVSASVFALTWENIFFYIKKLC